MMYRKSTPRKTTAKANEGFQGETIEAKVRRIMNNKEPITDRAPIIYTERKDGVQPAYDIRTDRWELAAEAMDHVTREALAKREARHAPKKEDSVGDQAAEGMKKEGEAPAGAN